MSEAEPRPTVFFSRCKPWNVDALEVALSANRIFFGYCMRKAGVEYKPNNLRSCIVDVTCDAEEWKRHHEDQENKRKEFNKNRNFAKKIAPGSIALIPRPSRGVIYCGIVEGDFELVDNPLKEEWYKTWEECWEKRWGKVPYDDPSKKITQKDRAALNDAWIAGEVAQTWRVDKFREIQAARIPVWIRRSFFGRSTYGTVKPQFGLNPYETLRKILDGESFDGSKPWTTEPGDIQQRLITDFTPSAFEHLIVALLQLEHPEEIWTHVGGSGDGGVDGMGADSSGELVGLLQCKWIYSGEPLELAEVWEETGQKPARYLAAAHHTDDTQAPDGFNFLNKEEIAKLLIKHATRLPQAIALRVGTAPNAATSSASAHVRDSEMRRNSS